MDKLKRGRMSDKEANRILKEILKEDKLDNEKKDEGGSEDKNDAEDGDKHDESDSDETEHCLGDCAIKKKCCACARIAENSSRFCVRVMEAMRALQENEDATMQTSSIEEIVKYIEDNYNSDGDLYTQVRIALKQVCSQGFVMELLENEYHFVGPDATLMNYVTALDNNEVNLISGPTKKSPSCKRRKDTYDDCDCGETTEEEQVPSRKIRRNSFNESKNMSRRQRNADVNDVLAEETADSTDEGGVLEDERQGSVEYRDVHDNSDNREMRENQIRTDQERENEEDDSVSQAVDDIYREMETENPRRSKKDERELREWLKRCQLECIRRKKRRGEDN